ncbi:MAG: EAL domain-containing protein, partial [Lachnospiraceae bacterium]|nr:EAL domain-containing protein [Lachnospiraceae bacterium]
PPDSFIPILERDPLFPELGEWILRRAVEDAEKIRHQEPDFIIHVNLSSVQLEQPDFIDRVWNILRTTGFPPDHLCLEITERCRLLDMNMLLNIVVALRAGGVKVALDDFGTGYSSVGLLKNLPFDIIKIDRSFVQNIETDQMEEKLVAFFSDVGGMFGANVCVEGIETAGMRDIMRKYRIHSFQGYYYSRPVEAEEIMAKLTGNA